MNYQRAAKSDVVLEEDSSHRSALPVGKDFMEVNGLIARGESEGMEICVLAMIWQLGGGEHMGVDLDLTLGGTGNAARVYGPWEDLLENGRGGYENCCWAEGTVSVNGHTYTLENGWGDHGVLTFGENYDQVAGMREGYYYVWVWHEDMQLFFWVMPSSGIGSGFAYMPDGRVFLFSGESIEFKDTASYVEWGKSVLPFSGGSIEQTPEVSHE
jgi:hypothetical protein